MTLESTLNAIEHRLAQIPPRGHARQAALDDLTVAVWRDHGGHATVRTYAARIELEGVTAHGVDAAGALRNWCGTVRRGLTAETAA